MTLNKNFNLNKKWLILGAVGFVILFLVFSFIVSYYEYKTRGPVSEEHVSTYDEDSFKRLHQQLTKDKPQAKEQQKLLAEIVNGSNQPKNITPTTARNGEEKIYSKGSFDTLAVNCSILLEKYKELAIKYHELEKQVKQVKPVKNKVRTPAQKQTGSSARYTSRGNPSPGGFDYTRYIRGSSSNQLVNDGGNSFANKQFTWVTLSLRQSQKVFDQSMVVFDVAEAFELEGISIPGSAKVEGVAQVSRGRGRIFINFNKIYTLEQTINIEGEAFSLDRSRGINVFVHGENSLAESFKREATDLVGLIDPSRSSVGRSLIRDTDVGQEVFATLEAGTMVLAKIRTR